MRYFRRSRRVGAAAEEEREGERAITRRLTLLLRLPSNQREQKKAARRRRRRRCLPPRGFNYTGVRRQTVPRPLPMPSTASKNSRGDVILHNIPCRNRSCQTESAHQELAPNMRVIKEESAQQNQTVELKSLNMGIGCELLGLENYKA